jgi:hypothetical protein
MWVSINPFIKTTSIYATALPIATSIETAPFKVVLKKKN